MKTVDDWAFEILEFAIDVSDGAMAKGLGDIIQAIRQEAVEECIKIIDDYSSEKESAYLRPIIRKVGEAE